MMDWDKWQGFCQNRLKQPICGYTDELELSEKLLRKQSKLKFKNKRDAIAEIEFVLMKINDPLAAMRGRRALEYLVESLDESQSAIRETVSVLSSVLAAGEQK